MPFYAGIAPVVVGIIVIVKHRRPETGGGAVLFNPYSSTLSGAETCPECQ